MWGGGGKEGWGEGSRGGGKEGWGGRRGGEKEEWWGGWIRIDSSYNCPLQLVD